MNEVAVEEKREEKSLNRTLQATEGVATRRPLEADVLAQLHPCLAPMTVVNLGLSLAQISYFVFQICKNIDKKIDTYLHLRKGDENRSITSRIREEPAHL